MPKFYLQAHWEKPDSYVVIERQEECLSDVLELLQDFLRACGYQFEGYLDIIDDEEQS